VGIYISSTKQYLLVVHRCVDSRGIRNGAQEELFFNYVGMFIRMVEKRGTACLLSNDIYKSMRVEKWFRHLMSIAFVVPSGTKGCLVREGVNTRPKIVRVVSSSVK
jgi:hypothetical protein